MEVLYNKNHKIEDRKLRVKTPDGFNGFIDGYIFDGKKEKAIVYIYDVNYLSSERIKSFDLTEIKTIGYDYTF